MHRSLEQDSTSYLDSGAQTASLQFDALHLTRVQTSAICLGPTPLRHHNHTLVVQRGPQSSCHTPDGGSPHRNGSILMLGTLHALHSCVCTQSYWGFLGWHHDKIQPLYLYTHVPCRSIMWQDAVSMKLPRWQIHYIAVCCSICQHCHGNAGPVYISAQFL